MRKPLDQEIIRKLNGISDYPKLLEAIASQRDLEVTLQSPEDYFRSKLKALRQKIAQSPQNMDDLLNYSLLLFSPVYDPDACFKAYAQVLHLNPSNPQAHHYIGKVLMNNGLFSQAYLLFNKGLGLPTPSQTQFQDCHSKFHYDFTDLIGEIHQVDGSIDDFGFPNLPFQFDEEHGFYLPDFDYNSPNADYKEAGMKRGKERTLLHIHGDLGKLFVMGNKPHEADNCPYLKYLSRL